MEHHELIELFINQRHVNVSAGQIRKLRGMTDRKVQDVLDEMSRDSGQNARRAFSE
jgi:hypothetical protein